MAIVTTADLRQTPMLGHVIGEPDGICTWQGSILGDGSGGNASLNWDVDSDDVLYRIDTLVLGNEEATARIIKCTVGLNALDGGGSAGSGITLFRGTIGASLSMTRDIVPFNGEHFYWLAAKGVSTMIAFAIANSANVNVDVYGQGVYWYFTDMRYARRGPMLK